MAKKPQKPAKPRKTAPRTKARAASPARGEAPATSRLLDLEPDRLPITERRAKYLAERAGIEVKSIAGRTLAEVHEQLRWRIDPALLFFRRICGQVVKRDPVTGALLPVPNATVHVEDTDCGFLSYFPPLSPYVWLYPFGCRREEIAAVRTDECGRFCVYLPWWDIDRILRWRRLRICQWEFFRPRIRDILERIPERRVPIPDPRPEPGPDPRRIRSIPVDAIERLRDVAGDEVVRRLEATSELGLQGESAAALDELLDRPLFAAPIPPPLPKDLAARREARELDASKLGIDSRLGIDPRLAIEKLDFRAFIGPFLRCWDLYIPTWQTVFDVPDITFRVTQDYDNDGVEEVIYSEGYFDVRWNSGSIPDVTLEASGLAVATQNCGPVVEVACTNVASIETAGYLDLDPQPGPEPSYHDDTDGYGLRVNRPSPTGDYPPPPIPGVASSVAANAPYAGNLNLHGCARIGTATHYRLRYEYRATSADPWGVPTTFLGIVWVAPRLGPGAPILFVPDGDGWYELLPAAILVHPNWLLPWNTAGGGIYRLELELGRLTGGVINLVGASAKRVFRVDNSTPVASFTEVRWRVATAVGPWNDANSTVVLPAPPNTCPVIHRPTGQDIHLRVVWTAAATHLRDATLTQSGCGGGDLVMLDAGGAEAYRHWHTGPLDNNISQTNHYLLPASRPPGCYTLGIHAWSRAFNPQDFDAASTLEWRINQGFLGHFPSRAISVVNV